MLNCKAGDLAIQVRSRVGNTGKIVKCLSIAKLGEEIKSDCGTSYLIIDTEEKEHATWHIEESMKWTDGKFYKATKDSDLRPLRDNDGEDEMLRIAGLPHKEPAY